MLQGSMQHAAPSTEDWTRQRSIGHMKNSRAAGDMTILHQESEEMTPSVKMSFQSIQWSDTSTTPTVCASCSCKSPTGGNHQCFDCATNYTKYLRATSSAPSTPTLITKQEPLEPRMFSSEAMAKNPSAMSYDSAYGSSINDSLAGMAGAFHESPGGYSGYTHATQMPYDQAPSQYGNNDSQFEYSVSMYDEPLDPCQAVSPMDQSIYPMTSPLIAYDSSPQLGSPVTFTGSQHMTDPSPSPQAAEMLTPSPKEKFQCNQSDCGRSFSRQADLQRHYDHVHPGPDASEKGHPCDYPRCARQVQPFRRKDHFRDHLREFHKEDLLRRGGQETVEWFKDRNINPLIWRCGRCLRRNSLDKRGYTCFKCKVDCEPARVNYRQKQRRATVQSPRELRMRTPSVQGRVRVSKKSLSSQRGAARLTPSLERINTHPPSSVPRTSWPGPVTAPAAENAMTLFTPRSPYSEAQAPLDGFFPYSEE